MYDIRYILPLHFFLLSMQPVVDAFDPRLLIAAPMFHVLDFTKIKVKNTQFYLVRWFIFPEVLLAEKFCFFMKQADLF